MRTAKIVARLVNSAITVQRDGSFSSRPRQNSYAHRPRIVAIKLDDTSTRWATVSMKPGTMQAPSQMTGSPNSAIKTGGRFSNARTPCQPQVSDPTRSATAIGNQMPPARKQSDATPLI